MDTSKSVSGFDIHGIYIEPLNKPSHYHMKVVLTNVDKANRILQGSLDMDIDGMQNNRKQTLNISTIVVDELGGLSFELKNFKQICPIEMLDKLDHPISLRSHAKKAG